VGAAGVTTLLAIACAAWILTPIPAALLTPRPYQTLTIEDRHGVVLRSTRAADGSMAGWVPLEQMDPDLLGAFVALEDRRFHDHHGVDWQAAFRAARDNLLYRRVVSGASTITMQLARLLQPIDRSWTGKLRQALWALRLEHHLGKQQILEQYLNRVPLGQGALGVSAGAALYFGASASDLSLGQAALLAGLAHSPSSDNPLVSLSRARARRSMALERLVALGHVLRADAARAAEEPLIVMPRTAPFLAPHFTTRLLLEADGRADPPSGVIRTSLDIQLQTALEAEVRHTVELLRDRGGRQAAVVVLDNRSGEVLAWVGSPDFWADTAGQVDMVVSPRQPGSALKPFLYGLAFDRGVTPATVLADVARTYETSSGPYHPRNYDRSFHGPVRAREALASSYNLPAVELADRIGFGTLLYGLHQAGFTSLDRSAEHYGLGLALGNGDVTLLELANGYRSLASGGWWRPVQWLATPPGDPAGAADGKARVMSASAAALVLDVLADADARIPGFGLSTPFDFPFPAAAKSGTSRNFTDNWSVGVTGNFTVAVWVGDFSGRPMEGVSGVSGAGPLLHRAMLVTAARYPPGALPRPAEAGAVPVTICRLSGLRATERCPKAVEWFMPGTAPERDCGWHRDAGVVLPAVYAEWVAGGEADGRTGQPAAERAGGSAAVAISPVFRITSPQDGDRYRVPPGVDGRYSTLALRAVGAPDDRSIRWYVDGRLTVAPRWPLRPGRHRIRAEASAVLDDEVEIVVE